MNPQLLRELTNYLSFRGPDAQEVWFDESAGLGHALLQIPSRGPVEKQPAQLEGRLWIIADALREPALRAVRAVLFGGLTNLNCLERSMSLWWMSAAHWHQRRAAYGRA